MAPDVNLDGLLFAEDAGAEDDSPLNAQDES
jgi:hypothetical protein